MKVNKIKMCKNKNSFQTIGAAKAAAKKFGQRVYECPVCFCYHCTSLDDWRSEFVTIEKHEELVKQNGFLVESAQKWQAKKDRYAEVINSQMQAIRQRNKKSREYHLKKLKILKLIKTTLDIPTFINAEANCKNLTKTLMEIEKIIGQPHEND